MLTKEQAETVLQPYYPKLKKCLDGGWGAWREHYKTRHHILDARAQASIVYCEMVDVAKMVFSTLSDTKLVKKGLTYLLYIGDDIVIRFKKLRNGLPHNIKTGQQFLFQQQTLPGVIAGTLVSAGYQLDAIEQAIEKTILVAQLDGRPVWSLDLNIGKEGEVAVLRSAPKKPRTSGRVKVRKDLRKKESQ